MKGRKLKIEVVILICVTYLFCGTMFVSCGGPSNDEVAERPAQPEATVTVFYPNGTTETFDGYDVSNGSNTMRVYYRTMDGVKTSTTLPTIVKSIQ